MDDKCGVLFYQLLICLWIYQLYSLRSVFVSALKTKLPFAGKSTVRPVDGNANIHLKLFLLSDRPDEVGKRVAASGGEGLRGEAV